MHRSSESVAALASALAKAQAELVNPEKSLTATIRTGRPGDGERSFRYAPLGSGLDIVRKTLGQHEIATVQTTAVDQAAGLVNLTTMLAHASGEWIASDWPVCPITEMANPQRMGAALTYARRYALFTLVGIAGEDDLDARDLCAPPPSTAVGETGAGGERGGNPAGMTDNLRLPSRSHGNGRLRGAERTLSAPALSTDQSAALRDRLLGEVAGLPSQESATKWAQGALAAKNRLNAEDAKLLEKAFEKRLAEFLPSESAEVVNVDRSESRSAGGEETGNTDVQQVGIDKSVLSVAARAAIATGSTFAISPSRRASCAAASPRTRTILDLPSPAPWVARSVTSSLSLSAEGTIVRPTTHATRVRGGGRPASIRSKSPAGSGRRRTDAASGDLNLSRMALPRPLTQRQ